LSFLARLQLTRCRQLFLRVVAQRHQHSKYRLGRRLRAQLVPQQAVIHQGPNQRLDRPPQSQRD
jgi:hypothetical protein